ncbi:hypothetical protein DNTS_016533 [Danionella cerebrum]|uniref:[Pyruvate dehydrogenase [acetyl-transferring]]-phosphatase 2, mitochondrial n=1 Tax=Danionella cerebrum TaxID=2873325 RepID=A0A553RC03_9TELE|nr:hypothetical protein DNTS_016533 [Danionella translucida]
MYDYINFKLNGALDFFPPSDAGFIDGLNHCIYVVMSGYFCSRLLLNCGGKRLFSFFENNSNVLHETQWIWLPVLSHARVFSSRGGRSNEGSGQEAENQLYSPRRHINFQPSRLQINTVLRANEQSVRIPEFDGRGGLNRVVRFESNQLPANTPLEDRRSSANCLQTRGMLFGVFDGHGGHACAQAVSERLPYYIAVAMMAESVLEDLEAAMETMRPVPPILQWHKHHNDYNYRESAALYVEHLRVYWQELLASEEHGDGMQTADALTYAFQRLDTDLSLEAQVPLANDLMRNTAIQAAFAGCTACVAHVGPEGVHVANAGDCRAVLGVQEDDGSWSALPLTRDHNAGNSDELERVYQQHPASERQTIIMDDRLLGVLMPLRAFGDVRFKWSRELQQSVLENGESDLEALNMYQYAPPNYLTPPYLEVTPEVTFHRLRPCDRFLILASDGLWDELSNDEAVRLVAEHLTGVHQQAPISAEKLNLGQMHQLLLRRRARATPALDLNAATHLIRHALGTNEYGEMDQERLATMLALPSDLARMYRDDITVNMSGENKENQKRPRDQLEENAPASNELENLLKKRRLAAGEEQNQDSKKSPARSRLRLIELEVKPDTPAIPSIRSRVEQLSQRREGEGEFSSRLERFKAPTPVNSPGRSTPCTRNLSSFVHGIQQQLSATVTPSTKEASRIRQAREDELRFLKIQPVAENMWLKRSLSDSSLTQEDLKAAEFSACEGDQKVFDESLHTSPPSAIHFPTEELYTSTADPEALSTSALIDQMFEEVLEHADKDDRNCEDMSHLSQTDREDETDEQDSGTQDPAKTELDPVIKEHQKELVSLNKENPDLGEKCEVEPPDASSAGEIKENQEGESEDDDDFLTPCCILSPLSKSVEAAVTPMKIVINASEPTTDQPPTAADNAPPLYSIDSYRSQKKIHPPSTQALTSDVEKKIQEETSQQKPMNFKGKIMDLNNEAAKLQTVITQTLQALSCCCDEDHGKGSLQEAEAEKLLLVSSEKRAALLAEVSKLREGACAEPETQTAMAKPCRGTVCISNIQLPLKVEFVCSAHTGRPTHYFFVLIRYGPCNIVATPLATAADAQKGDTITFPTSITLQDIRSTFEIDVEVYSLSNTPNNTCSINPQQFRSSTRSRVTPKKILNSITKSNQNVTSAVMPALGAQRSSNFSLVGSHKITLNSLGQSKFPLDKMKFEGKIRRLLGDEFQEKVPFLSPLEGHIYLQLHSEGHSNVTHQGFLTMFEDVSGFGAWQRFYFRLEGGHLLYWNYPNEMGSKPADGSLSLYGFCGGRPVERECCARPHTFELVETDAHQKSDGQALKKCWFSADSREERSEWMEKLNQTLLDSLTWNRKPVTSDTRASTSSNSGTSRESIL